MPLGDWPLVARAVLFAAIGVFGVYRDRRWVEAAFAAGSAALAAIVAVSISGRMNGTFLAPGIAPAISAANIIVITGFALLAGTVGAMMAHAIRRRSASKS